MSAAAAAEYSAPGLVAAMAGITAVALLFLGLRIFCKVRFGKPCGWDDYILALAWVILAAYAGLTIASTKFGVGQHVETLTPDDIVKCLMFQNVCNFFVVIAISTSKSSFVITLLRLTTSRWHVILLWSVLVSTNVIMALCCILILARCSPVQKVWDFNLPGTCWDPMPLIHFAVFAGAWSAAMDFILAGFPWVVVWHLRSMRTVERLGIGIAMSLGFLSGITAIIKTSCIIRGVSDQDFTYSSIDLLVWAGSEAAIVIVASSIPFLRHLPHAFSSQQRARPIVSVKLKRKQPLNTESSTFPSQLATESEPTAKVQTPRLDDQSDRSILERPAPVWDGGIRRTNEVTVEYEDGDIESNDLAIQHKQQLDSAWRR